MLGVRKRGRIYRLEGRLSGRRVRLSLSTRNHDAAILVASKVERAVVEGKSSKLWMELPAVLSPLAFRRLCEIAGRSLLTESPTWDGLTRSFTNRTKHLMARGKFRAVTWKRYRKVLTSFSDFLHERGASELREINRPIIEEFKGWRLEKILAKKHARQGGGLDLELAILHRVFAHAIECEMVERNPVKVERRHHPERGAQPFSANELAQLREAAGQDSLTFLILRHTGLRASDVADLRWREIDWKDRCLERMTQKRSKPVWIPLHPELAFALEIERDRRSPRPDEHILLTPVSRKPFDGHGLYQRIKKLGKRAGVSNSHPHRFRDTFAVDLLTKGASPYDVAKLLGDTIRTVELYYAPFVRELRERARRIVESGEGLEAMGTDWAHRPAPPKEVN